MKRNLFNKNDRYDLHKLGGFMNAGFKVQSISDLTSGDVMFCRHVMYWHQHYLTNHWDLPSWAQMPDFKNWMDEFSSSYRFYSFMRDAMDEMMQPPRDCSHCHEPMPGALSYETICPDCRDY